MTNWQSAYEDHGTVVRAYLKSRMSRPDDAEDLLQETFARAMTAPRGIRNPGAVRSYLMQTAHNLMVNHRRSLGRHASSESDLGEEFALDQLPDAAERGSDDRLERREIQERIEAALAELSEDHRLAVRMGLIERRPYAEIAQETGWTVSKVKIAVFRARKQMIEALAEEENP